MEVKIWALKDLILEKRYELSCYLLVVYQIDVAGKCDVLLPNKVLALGFLISIRVHYWFSSPIVLFNRTTSFRNKFWGCVLAKRFLAVSLVLVKVCISFSFGNFCWQFSLFSGFFLSFCRLFQFFSLMQCFAWPNCLLREFLFHSCNI